MREPNKQGIVVLNATSLRPAERTARLGFSDIVKIRNRVMEMQRNGAKVIRLEGGEPFMPTPDFIKDAMKRALDENQTRYAPSSGIPQLLEAINGKLAAKNHLAAPVEDIIVTNGGMHGLFAAFQATANPGDEILFFGPYWTPIRDLVNYCGAKPVLIPWEEVREADLREALEKRVSSKMRIIYVNTPANPTGDVLDRTKLEIIADFAQAHDLVIISDEAYEDLVYDEPHVSIASLPGMYERTLTVFTLSKSFSMTGWRVGYVVAAPLWMDVLKKIVLNSINGVSTPSQFAAAAAIGAPPSHFEAMLREYRIRRDLLTEAAVSAGFRATLPRGAFYLFVDVRERLGIDSWRAMEELLSRTSIATVPGVVFGNEGEGHLRMSFSQSMETLEEAVQALQKL